MLARSLGHIIILVYFRDNNNKAKCRPGGPLRVLASKKYSENTNYEQKMTWKIGKYGIFK
jgi:hypothetical protein